VSKRSGYIVVGHGRKIAGIEIGCLVPVEYQDFADEAEERLHLAADNKLAELAEIKLDKLEIEVMELAQLDIPVFDFGFVRPKDLSKIYGPETSGDEDEISRSSDCMSYLRLSITDSARERVMSSLMEMQAELGADKLSWKI
jgi:hypothetical protein